MQANATLETRLALKAAVLASPLGGRLRKASRADKLDADELAQQVADGLLFAGGYGAPLSSPPPLVGLQLTSTHLVSPPVAGTTHLTLAALERVSSDPALYVPLWESAPDAKSSRVISGDLG